MAMMKISASFPHGMNAPGDRHSGRQTDRQTCTQTARQRPSR